MNIEHLIREELVQAINDIFELSIPLGDLLLKNIPSHLEGDYSLVVFPLAKRLGCSPIEIASKIAEHVQVDSQWVIKAEAIKGFCNLTISDSYWSAFVKQVMSDKTFGHSNENKGRVLVEYSSPNTNKPIHLGHIRNNLLGYSMSEILKANGYDVKKVQIINDRGIHICKSMLAWSLYGDGETPESSNIKGDHLVGRYYVMFETKFKAEYKEWQNLSSSQSLFTDWLNGDSTKLPKGLDADSDVKELQDYFFGSVYKNTYFNQHSALGKKAKDMLKAWEAGDEAVVSLWKTMNQWVYDGFASTYELLGVDFDHLYYESNTYLLGRDVVLEAYNQNDSIFYKKEDGSTWVDLSGDGLDEKVVLRKDGTSMYITQDIGTAIQRYKDFGMDEMIYVVGNEQDYHFKVLFTILAKLGYDFADKCQHLSYGMVNLTTGRMKSREGTIVDADDLLHGLIDNVAKESMTRETLLGLTEKEQQDIWKKVALGALKFFILKVEARKTMVFDPKQSIELQGQTGPYIQNAYVRTQSVQQVAQKNHFTPVDYSSYKLCDAEREIVCLMESWPKVVQKAAQQLNPAEVANFMYDLAKHFHKFWNDVKIMDKEHKEATSFRMDLCRAVANVLQIAGDLLGIGMPQKM